MITPGGVTPVAGLSIPRIAGAASSPPTGTAGGGSPALAPAGLVNGDFLLGAFTSTSLVGGLTGWTQLYHDTSGANLNFDVWWKIASGEGPSWAWTFGGPGGWAVGRFPARSGINVSGHAMHVNASPVVTTTVSGCQIVQVTQIDEVGNGFTFGLDAACTSLVQGTLATQIMLSYDTTNQAAAGLTTARTITNSSPLAAASGTIALAP